MLQQSAGGRRADNLDERSTIHGESSGERDDLSVDGR
jgi:hypothetical protein